MLRITITTLTKTIIIKNSEIFMHSLRALSYINDVGYYDLTAGNTGGAYELNIMRTSQLPD